MVKYAEIQLPPRADLGRDVTGQIMMSMMMVMMVAIVMMMVMVIIIITIKVI